MPQPSLPTADSFTRDRVASARLTIFEEYRQRVQRADETLSAFDRRGARLANLRTVTFIAGALVLGLTLFGRLPTWGWIAGGMLMAIYGTFAVIHHRVIQEEERQKHLRGLSVRGLARLTHGWSAFPKSGNEYATETASHLYAPDLDLFGPGSLFQLLDDTATIAGEKRLVQWMLSPSPTADIEERQVAVKDLRGRIDFRQGLLVEATRIAQKKADPRFFIAWAEGTDLLAPIRWARPLAWLLPLTTLAVFVLGRFEIISLDWVWAGLLAHVIVIVLTRKSLGTFYERLAVGEQGFVRYEGAFSALEKENLEAPRLMALKHGLQASGTEPVSRILERFGRLFGFAELRQSGQMYAVIQWLTLWDLHWFFRLEAWRQRHGHQLRGWFEALAEVEALICLSTYAYEHPDFVFPKFVQSKPFFAAQALGHPLLDQPVVNDVSLTQAGEALLLTGSNMSGKTTLLRAMGINTVIAQMGAPVCATALSLSELRVVTSMRVKDSLERGVSYFYAEVQRMKAVLDAAKSNPGSVLFLLDEILLGTNTKERQVASRGLLRLLLETGAIGGVTTHDLSLTSLEQDGGERIAVRNFHFRDQLIDGQMRFDYRLRPGVVDTTNALRVLQLAGIELPASSM